MRRRLLWLLPGILVLLVSACTSNKDESFTIVEGTVLNKYTRLPMGAVPVSVGYFTYGAFGGGSYDSVATAYTDATGHYRQAFDAPGKGYYRVKVRSSQVLYDLTNYASDSRAYSDGAAVQKGITNQVNFEITPYKTVTVNAKSSKNGKTDIQFAFIAWDQQGNDFRGDIFGDSVRSIQQIAFTKTVKVLPNRLYRFVKITSNRVRVGLYNVDYRDETWVDRYRTVLYNDTTVINFN